MFSLDKNVSKIMQHTQLQNRCHTKKRNELEKPEEIHEMLCLEWAQQNKKNVRNFKVFWEELVQGLVVQKIRKELYLIQIQNLNPPRFYFL